MYRLPAALLSEPQFHNSLAANGLNNSSKYLRDFITSLVDIEDLKVLNGADFVQSAHQETSERSVFCTIRVDCCSSISAALDNAAIYRDLGISATFFLNHNSTYWQIDRDNDSYKCRSGFITDRIITEIVKMGHTIGLHNDVLGLVGRGLDVRLSLNMSVAFLQRFQPESNSSGYGMAAHNSAWTNGFESFHVFTEYSKNFEGKNISAVSISDTGLGWEINMPICKESPRIITAEESLKFGRDPIRNREFLVQYFIEHPSFRRGYQWETWLLARNKWVVVDYSQDTVEFPLDFEGVLTFIRSQKGYGVILIHPEYCSDDLR